MITTYNATFAVKLFNVTTLKVLNHTERKHKQMLSKSVLGSEGRSIIMNKLNLSLSESNLNNSVNPQCLSLESVPENPLKGRK